MINVKSNGHNGETIVKYLTFLFLLFSSQVNAQPYWAFVLSDESVDCSAGNCTVDVFSNGAAVGFDFGGSIYAGAEAYLDTSTGLGASIFSGYKFNDNFSFNVGIGKQPIEINIVTEIAIIGDLVFTPDGPTNSVEGVMADERSVDDYIRTKFLSLNYSIKQYSFYLNYSKYDDRFNYRDTEIETFDVGAGTFTRNSPVDSTVDIDGSNIGIGFKIRI